MARRKDSGMLLYLRLWRRFVLMAVARETVYRTSFLLSVGEGLAQLALALLTVAIVYRFTTTVAGWSQAQVFLLVGIYRVMDGLISVQVAPNMFELPHAINGGDLDFVLVSPVSSQFLVSLRRLALTEVPSLLIGLGLTVYAGNLAGVRWSIGAVAEATGLGLCGLLVLYALWFALETCSFWLVGNSSLNMLFYSVFEAARYPLSFFGGRVRTLLTFIIPIAFATTFPAEALLGRADGRLLPIGLALAAGALIMTHLFWHYAVQHYASASS